MEEERILEDYNAFKRKMVGPRGEGKVSNSWGIYDAYKLMRKNKWYDIGRPLREHEFYKIIRSINDLIAAEAGMGGTITLPMRMGTLELRKFQPDVRFVEGKLRISYPVDWESTLKLWFMDEEAKRSKILIRLEEKDVYKVKYCKHKANYENKSFYEFSLNRKVKQALKRNIKEGIVDTMYAGY